MYVFNLFRYTVGTKKQLRIHPIGNSVAAIYVLDESRLPNSHSDGVQNSHSDGAQNDLIDGLRVVDVASGQDLAPEAGKFVAHMARNYAVFYFGKKVLDLNTTPVWSTLPLQASSSSSSTSNSAVPY